MSSFKINKLTPNIGAEIIGKNIFDNLTTTVCDKIYEALIENKVILFRDQKISPIQHINFAKSFGDIEPPHPVYPHVDEYPEIVLLENDEQNPPDTDEWHTDLTFRPNPPFASILYSKIIPQYGGDTLWTCLTSIYEALPIELKKYLTGEAVLFFRFCITDKLIQKIIFNFLRISIFCTPKSAPAGHFYYYSISSGNTLPSLPLKFLT